MSLNFRHRLKTPKHLIIFVHGLGGNIESFQNNDKRMFHKYLDTSILLNCDIAYYTYTSKLVSSKIKSLLSNYFSYFSKEFNNEITEISDILKTDCLNNMTKYETINFICHSMGGLIVKDLLLNKNIKFKNKIFYITLATPHKGSKLADKIILIKDNHSQIKVLKTDSHVLAQLNTEFKHQKEKFNRKYYYALHDAVVLKDSALSENDDISLRVGVDGNHVSICKPTSDSGSQTLLLNLNETIITFLNIKKTELSVKNRPDRLSSVLFDSYSQNNKLYYLYRNTDSQIANILNIKNIWIHGKSGVGKTNIAQYYCLNNERKFYHSTYFTISNNEVEDYLRLIYEELIDKIKDNTFQINDTLKINTKLSKVFCYLSQHYENVTIHLDELSDLGDLRSKDFFIALVDILTNQRDNCALNNVNLIITTLFNPVSYINELLDESYREKINGQFSFYELEEWSKDDLFKLYTLISKEINVHIENIENKLNILNGKPRGLKDIFKTAIATGDNNA